MEKRALILGPGGLRGAYGGGVAATLCRALGSDYFDTVYGCSAGAYTGSYYLTGQADQIESIWREHVHGSQLVRWKNALRRKQVLDLDYLNDVVRNGVHRLDSDMLLKRHNRLVIVLTERLSGCARYISPTAEEELFCSLKASSAAPYVHSPVAMNGRVYADGCLSDPYPVERAVQDGHSQILVVCNHRQRQSQCLAEVVRILAPTSDAPMRWNMDRSKVHINRMIDRGVADATAFLESL